MNWFFTPAKAPFIIETFLISRILKMPEFPNDSATFSTFPFLSLMNNCYILYKLVNIISIHSKKRYIYFNSDQKNYIYHWSKRKLNNFPSIFVSTLNRIRIMLIFLSEAIRIPLDKMDVFEYAEKVYAFCRLIVKREYRVHFEQRISYFLKITAPLFEKTRYIVWDSIPCKCIFERR